MNAVSIGPLVFATDRLAALLGILAFMAVASILGRRVDARIGSWSNWSLLAGLVTARIGHVALHWASFADEPWRIVAFWQGGFHLGAGLLGVALVTALFIRSAGSGLGAVASLGVGLLVWTGGQHLAQATLGQPAPAIALPQLDGPPLAIADVAGTPAVVNIWASWCPPCRREMPLLADAAADRKDVAFLFVNVGEGPDKIRSYLSSQNLSLGRILLDQAMQIPHHYGTLGVPVTLFLRADGTLASMHTGEISREALQAGIKKIIDPS